MDLLKLDGGGVAPASFGYDRGISTARLSSTEQKMDAYFSADVETDGPIPGPYSMLSFALVYAGSFDGHRFSRPADYKNGFYSEMRPISDKYQDEALAVNNIDRRRLVVHGRDPVTVMNEAGLWIRNIAGEAQPVLVAYPLSFDWTWLYWYFVQYASVGSPFSHSRCFDIKTAFAVKAGIPLAEAGRSQMPASLKPQQAHTHHALDDAIEQAQIFANVFEWKGRETWVR